MEKTNRLYRSSTSKVFGGVAGGIAEYFDVDPIIIRMLFVVIAFAGGGGLLVYLILWIAIPPRPIFPPNFNMGSGSTPPPPFTANPEPGDGTTPPPFNAEPVYPEGARPDQSYKGGLIGGLVLITLGSIFLADKFIPRVSFHDLWPLVLVVIGAVLIFTNFTDKKKPGKQ
ncbi:MAG: PspC domain-containing protein [Bacteroidales bacterium]|nr:PspC domain-containing protein [Bacteroidales bacterium]